MITPSIKSFGLVDAGKLGDAKKLRAELIGSVKETTSVRRLPTHEELMGNEGPTAPQTPIAMPATIVSGPAAMRVPNTLQACNAQSSLSI